MDPTYRICRRCNCYMNLHPESRQWIKCCCGFTKVEKPMITLEAYLMDRDKKYPQDYTEELKQNANVLIEKVNSLLLMLRIDKVQVTSGWRPKTYNDTIKNASKTSRHITCQAVDMQDSDSKLKNLCMSNLNLLEQLGLYMEHPDDTPTWIHLQTMPPASKSRVFRARSLVPPKTSSPQ